ncbi:MAG TPA: effector-associated domain EAD1-containing protein [Gemmataceae bacterium]|nr:effector-associated domain EAD1-containing protein [Gemmataceae bacterium]
MPELRDNGPLAAELKRILLAAFDRQELADLLSEKLNIRLDEEVIQESEPGQEVTMAAIRYVDRRDRLDDLLSAAMAARPMNSELRQFATRRGAGRVRDAVRSLADRLRADPNLKAGAVQFRTHFATARDEMFLLDRYKVLHDCLHKVQLRVQAIGRVAAAFPADAGAATELAAYLDEFRDAAHEARQYATEVLTSADELVWIDEFDRALTDAQKALDDADPKRLAEAVEALQRVPLAAVEVNRNLIGAARRVRLDRLGEALDSLIKAVDGPGVPDADRKLVEKLRAGLDGVRALAPQLAGLIDTHASWQRVDTALAAAETAADAEYGAGPERRVPRWPQVKDLLKRLCPVPPADVDRSNPAVLTELWEKAPTPVASENQFIALRAAALRRFVIVDKQLLKLCEQLTNTIQPLTDLLEVL